MSDYTLPPRPWRQPPRYYRARRELGAAVGLLDHCRYDIYIETSLFIPLGRIISDLNDLISDDEFGLIGATPEERVRFMEAQK